MKEQFKQWLISLNSPFIDALGVDSIASRVSDTLEPIHCNNGEMEVLERLLCDFFDTLSCHELSEIC
ncbi:hypothetical protein [Aggregatibacter kilianii]|uniref:hypothetical protein n=1 Tax=Aggregatibacter kilianii TaxID=2025884 RepID=UPI000D65C252|nr:hypothetical protein [Aggregatibacter kilianii]